MNPIQNRSRSRRALGAAVAGILAGASFALGCGSAGEAGVKPTVEANGCNGPNGCGSEDDMGDEGGTGKHAEEVADANGCNGANGCSGAQE